MRARFLAIALFTAPLWTSCVGTREVMDPTLVITTERGEELGVSTDYGVVFLGHTAQAGEIEVTAWFGDGPSVERAVIEPIGGDIYTAETEIRLPTVPLSFDQPARKDRLRVIGRRGRDTWSSEVKVLEDPRVDGILVSIPSALRGASNDQVGAGLYECLDDDCIEKKLVGLISGRLRIDGQDRASEYLTVVGPRELWRLVTHRRDLKRRKPWVYREDIL